jgi:hypothetical protein
MYTDWGNLKIVRCRAWFQGLDPAAQRRAGGMDALGASIFTFKRTQVLHDTMKVPIGRCRNSRVQWSLLLIQKQWRIRLAAYGARLERVLG